MQHVLSLLQLPMLCFQTKSEVVKNHLPVNLPVNRRSGKFLPFTTLFPPEFFLIHLLILVQKSAVSLILRIEIARRKISILHPQSGPALQITTVIPRAPLGPLRNKRGEGVRARNLTNTQEMTPMGQ